MILPVAPGLNIYLDTVLVSELNLYPFRLQYNPITLLTFTGILIVITLLLRIIREFVLCYFLFFSFLLLSWGWGS